MVLRYYTPGLLMGVFFFFFLPVCAGYDNYSDVIEWEPVTDQAGGVVAHYYQWNNKLSSIGNSQQIYNPVFFDLPGNTDLCKGGGPIQWTYLNIIGPKYAVRYKNETFSNSTDVFYEVGYLPRPKRALNSGTIDSVTATEAEIKEGILKVTITCNWHKSKRRASGGIKKEHKITTIHQKAKYEINQWVAVDEYNETIECVITNHSGQYNIINMVGLPGNVSHYNISVKMGNKTRSLLKSSYVYFKNESVDYQLYDMYDYDFYDLSGLSPYGKDSFLLPGGHIDNISIVISSPFESYELETNITRKDEAEDIKTGDMCAVFMCFLTGYILYRMVR